LATGTAVWTGKDVVFSDGSDFAVVYRPSTRQWGRVPDGTNWNRATAHVVAADGLVARWSGYPLTPTAASDPAGLLMRMPDQLPEPAPPAPTVADAPALADILGTTPSAADQAPGAELAVPDLGWTLSFSSGQAELIEESGSNTAYLHPGHPNDTSTLIGPIGPTPPASGRWTIAIVSTAPQLAVLQQPTDPAWTTVQPLTEVEAPNGPIYIYVVDGGAWADGYNTVAFPT
jgi:hypothetical protein